MIRRIRTRLGAFGRDENGQMLIEFALAIPLIFTLFMTSVEMGIFSMRQMFLERGLDMAVRNVRLNTGVNYTHSDIKTMICEYSNFLEDCETALKLELRPVNPRAFAGFESPEDCADISQPVTPSRTFVHGAEHELMLVQACYMFDPVFPTSGLGYALTKDGSGRSKMIALSGFVQEPNT